MSLRKLDQIGLAAEGKHWVVPVASDRVLVCLERIRYRLNGRSCVWLGGRGGCVVWEDCCWRIARKEAGEALRQRLRQLDVSGGGRHGEICRLSWS